MNVIYFRNFRPKHYFNEVDFELSSSYDIHVEPEYNIIDGAHNYVDISIELEEFKMTIIEKESVISDVKLIVGKNGVGKTSVIREIINFCGNYSLSFDRHNSWKVLLTSNFLLLGNNVRITEECFQKLRETLPNLEVVVGYESFLKNNYWCQSLDANERLFNSEMFKTSGIINYSNSLNPYLLIEQKGELHSSEFIYGKKVFDISTSNYLVKTPRWENKTDLAYIVGGDSLTSLDNIQTKEFLTNLAEIDWFKELIPDSILSKIKIEIEIGQIGNMFRLHVLDLKTIGGYPNYSKLRRIKQTNLSPKGIFAKELIDVILCSLIDSKLVSGTFLSDIISQVLTDFDQAVNFDDLIYDVHELPIQYLENSTLIKAEDSAVLINQLKIFNKELFGKKILKKIDYESINLMDGVMFSLSQTSEILRSISTEYNKLMQSELLKYDVLKFWTVNVSTGERNFLFLMTRLFKIIIDNDDLNTFVLFLDEPGNDYHPEWQRRFFFDLKKVLDEYKRINDSFSIQVIITTHSPFILSDFPERNIIRLNRKKDSDGVFKTFSDGRSSRTFGANIYDVMRDAFFLENGFCGEFAKNTIDSLFKKLRSSEVFDEEQKEEFKYLINVVGEPMVKRQLAIEFDKKNNGSLAKEIIDKEIRMLTEMREKLL